MLKIEELQEGEIYSCYHKNVSKNNKSIFKATKDNKNVNRVTYELTSFFKSSNYSYGLSDIQIATFKEKHWLNECIKADKFISYEEAMKTFKEESLVGRYVKSIKEFNSNNPVGSYDKIIGDNKDCYWLERFLTASKDKGLPHYFNNLFELMPEGWTPEQEKPEYEVGKWYKTSKSSYVKFSKLNETYFYGSEYIHYEKGYINEEGYFRHTEPGDIFTLTNLSEIQQYLPDGHVDKFPIKSKELSILEQAKLKYPVGTKYELAHKPNEGIIHIITGDLTWGNGDNIYGVNFIDGKKHDGCVYYKGQWAKIITYEIPQEINNSNSDVIEIGDEVEIISSLIGNWYKVGEQYKVINISENGTRIHKDNILTYWINYKDCKIVKKASQTTLLNKKVDGISPVKVNTKLLDIIKIKGSAPTKVEKKRIKLTILKTKQLNLN
jgi:hypothetical protein